ncbi:MAG: SAM-dependent methyltransferase [Micromonosporaceae bacterium]
MTRPDWAPTDVDLDQPSAARMYDFVLGGSHNFEVDRALARKILQVQPHLPDEAKANRAFLRRVVRLCVKLGIRQFIDIGSGIPTVGNVHDVAQQLNPEARVLYADIDPVAVAHSQTILADDPRTRAIQADFCQPDTILDSAAAHDLIDFDQPVALLLVTVLHFVPDEKDPVGIIRRIAERLAVGSYVAASHVSADIDNPATRAMVALLNQMATPVTLRSKAEITALFQGFTLLEPGVAPTSQWRPDADDPTQPAEAVRVYAAVGRKEETDTE